MEPIQFGNFTLLERISHGGMAEVFRAKSFGEAGFEREVALKILLPSVASDQDFINMLIDEAKIAGQLNHANIAQIFDLGVADERYYIVQEFVKGKDLRAILKHKLKTKTHLDVAKSCYIALKVCEGLHYAHNKEDVKGKPLNLVHRDISPHNILISDEGEVKIIDFGIAKAEGRATQTMAGLVKGKFAYMSPEQIRGLPVDHRSDIFATGILLHEMLTTRPLFGRSSEFETLKRARSAMAEPPSESNPLVPKALDTIVLKALARHVDDRYQSSQEFRDALWSFAREHNAFEIDENTGSGRTLSPEGTESSIEIEIGSEVKGLGNPSIPSAGKSNEHDGYEITIEGSEATELAPPSMMQPPPLNPAANYDPNPAANYDDYGEDEENQTVVDPGMPFGVPGMSDDMDTDLGVESTASDFTPTDHDAKWASQAISSQSKSGVTAQSPLGATLDESANHGINRNTARTVSDAVATKSFAAQSAPEGLPSDRRVTTPAIPKQRGPMPMPDDNAAATFRHSSFDEQSIRKSGLKAPEDQWSPTTPTTLAGANKNLRPVAAARQAQPIPTPISSTQLGMPPVVLHKRKSNEPMQTPPGQPSDALIEPTGSMPLSIATPTPAPKPILPPPPSQVMRAQSVVTPEDAPTGKRLYLLMSAIFLLLLAAAATITMLVNE